ncbi:hypothetical protein [Faecalispora sporosphaeroides]|uniref:hypothetical protein n=1 Tax=Faecalispora sporosphaeroides TaxID=1549 RepID=UPI0003AB3843|nr:hypothetical protein [Faecalispora sporosphaeroides]
MENDGVNTFYSVKQFGFYANQSLSKGLILARFLLKKYFCDIRDRNLLITKINDNSFYPVLCCSDFLF